MVRSRMRRRVVTALTAVLAAAGALAVPATAAPVSLDLGALGKAVALTTCATDAFVDGRPGAVRVSYGMNQVTPSVPVGSFILRNHKGGTLFCDMLGRDRPSQRPFPTTSAIRPAVHYTNPVQNWNWKPGILVGTSSWLRVQDPVQSARTRFFVDGVAGPWFVSQRQGRFIHLQSWLLTTEVPDSVPLKIQTQVRNGAGQVMTVPGLSNQPRTLTRGIDLG